MVNRSFTSLVLSNWCCVSVELTVYIGVQHVHKLGICLIESLVRWLPSERGPCSIQTCSITSEDFRINRVVF